MEFGMPYLLELNSVEECCIFAKELSLSFVELNVNFPACNADRLDPAKLYDLMRRYGVYFTLHIEEECDPFTLNATVRDAWKKSLRRILEVATALRIPIVNMHFPRGVYITLPERRVFIYEQFSAEFYSALFEFRTMCEETLADSSTRIAIENTNGWHPHEMKAIEYLLKSPIFGLTLDTGHCHCCGNADEPFFRKHCERLIHMHGHDAIGKRDHLILGAGEIDLCARFSWAAENQARIVLETKTVQALSESIKRLPKFL